MICAFQCIHQIQSSLTYQMPTLFSSKQLISGSHPDNLVCDETQLTRQKGDPSDPDCLGHLTHFQPCSEDCDCLLYRFSGMVKYEVGNRKL